MMQLCLSTDPYVTAPISDNCYRQCTTCLEHIGASILLQALLPKQVSHRARPPPSNTLVSELQIDDTGFPSFKTGGTS